MYFVFILHVIVLYLLELLGYHNIMLVQCSGGDSINWGGGGGGGEFGQFSKFQRGGGVEEFSGPRKMKINGGWPILGSRGDGLCRTFSRGVQTPEDTMVLLTDMIIVTATK